jgi:trehalose 2-sulfotransferase
MSLSLCVVARNEALFLRACLDSARPIVDEIVVVDTGSTDDTPEIARSAGARVIREAWPGDLGRAHNLPLEHARGDWILTLDADEVLDPGSYEHLRRLTEGGGDRSDGYVVAIRNYVHVPGEKLRLVDARDPLARGASSYIPTSVVRLFRRRREYRFAGCLHQSMESSILAAGGRVGESDLRIHHYGFLRTDRLKQKLYRTLARQQVEAEPTSAQAWIDFGSVFTGRSDLPVALEAFRRARRHGERAGSAFLLGTTLVNMGYAAAAVPYLQEALRRNRRDACPSYDRADAFEQLAEAYEALGHPRRAERAYRQALEARPESPLAMNNLAALLVERLAWRQAHALLDRLLARFPGLDTPWATLGLLRLGRRDLEGARRAFETALEINSANLPARINLGATYRLAGHARKAVRAYAAAWDLFDGRPAHELSLTSCLPPRPRRSPLRPLGKGGVVSIIAQLYGGSGRVLVDIVGALRDRRHLVLCGDPGPYSRQGLSTELKALGAELRTFASPAAVRAAVADVRPEYVIHHWWDDGLIGEPPRARDEHWIALGHVPLPMPHGYDGYVVGSAFHRSFQMHLPEGRIHQIPNGVRLSRFHRPALRPHRPVTIAMLSRLDPAKFPRRLLAFLPPLRRLGARVLVAGRGGRRCEIEPEIARDGFGGDVRFLGGLPAKRVPDFLHAADIGLHLTETHQEICSLAILEMLAAGLPVVAEPKGGLPELISDGENGFLVETEEEVAARLADLIETPELRRRMGAASRRMARRYSIDRFSASWRDLLARPSRSLGVPGASTGSGVSRDAPTSAGRSRVESRRSARRVPTHAARGVPVNGWRPRLSFLVCATPRSGSTLLCEALWNTGLAGRPQEFFNIRTKSLVMEESTTADFAGYLSAALEDGSSANGIFGAKLFHDDLAPLLRRVADLYGALPRPSTLLEQAFPGLRYVWIVRRDKLRQAISFYRAIRSDRWVSDGFHDSGPRPRYDRQEIARCQRQLQSQETAWRLFFETNDIQPMLVHYEDLDGDYEGTARAVLRYLGISPPRPLFFGGRRHLRQSDAITERWIRRFQKQARA